MAGTMETWEQKMEKLREEIRKLSMPRKNRRSDKPSQSRKSQKEPIIVSHSLKDPRGKLGKLAETMERGKMEKEKSLKSEKEKRPKPEKEKRYSLDKEKPEKSKQHNRRGRSRKVHRCVNSKSKAPSQSQEFPSSQSRTVSLSSPLPIEHLLSLSQVNSYPAPDLSLDSQMTLQAINPSVRVSTCPHESSVSESITIVASGKGLTGTIISEIHTELKQVAPTVSENSEADILQVCDSDVCVVKSTLTFGFVQERNWLNVLKSVMMDCDILHIALEGLKSLNKFDRFGCESDTSMIDNQNGLEGEFSGNITEYEGYVSGVGVVMYLMFVKDLNPGRFPEVIIGGVGLDYRFDDSAMANSYSVARSPSSMSIVLVNGIYRDFVGSYLDSSIFQHQQQKLNVPGSFNMLTTGKEIHFEVQSTTRVWESGAENTSCYSLVIQPEPLVWTILFKDDLVDHFTYCYQN